MYPGPNGASENHKRGYCSDGAKQTLKQTQQNRDPPKPGQPISYTIPKWPQPQGVFTDGTSFDPLQFLAKLREIYEKVVIENEGGGEVAMEQEAFASLLMARLLVRDDGSVLLKLFDLDCAPTTPESLIVTHEGDKYLLVHCLQEPLTSPSL